MSCRSPLSSLWCRNLGCPALSWRHGEFSIPRRRRRSGRRRRREEEEGRGSGKGRREVEASRFSAGPLDPLPYYTTHVESADTCIHTRTETHSHPHANTYMGEYRYSACIHICGWTAVFGILFEKLGIRGGCPACHHGVKGWSSCRQRPL